MPGCIKYFKKRKTTVVDLLPLVLHLKGSGGYVDLTGTTGITQANMQIVASPTNSSEQVFQFNGTSSRMTIQNYATVLPATADFTIEFDYYPLADVSRTLFTSHTYTSNSGEHPIKIVQGTIGVCTYTHQSYGSISTPNNTAPINNWYHVSAQKTGNIYSLYFNSSYIGTFNTSVGIQTTNRMSFGCGYNSTNSSWANFFNGYMNNIQIRSKVPT